MTTESKAALYPRCLEPLSVGGIEIKNRIMVSGHTQLYGHDGLLSDRHLGYYRERAMGGAGLLILEQQGAHPSGRNYHAGCVAWDERAIPWYARLADAVHEFGATQFVQLFACGAQGSGTQYMDDWRPLWAASRIPSAVTEEMPVAMEQADIDELIEYFARSAANVQRGGLDGVEIHAAHSQLLGEFLSPAFNKRSDGYNGSVANRCRIVLEIGEAIRARVGSDFPLGLRLSYDEYLPGTGITAEQTEEQLEIFSSAALFDFFDISAGGYHTLHIAVAPMGTMPEGFLAESAKRAKEIVGDRARIFVVGRVLDLDKAENMLADGVTDMVAMTRAHMSDAHLVNKSLAGAGDTVNRCVGANVCLTRLIDNREVTCFQNPTMGREAYWGKGRLNTVKEADAKAFVVVGAGPAGLRFAATAARRGHQVKILEADAEPGGRLNLLKSLPSRSAWQQAIDNLTRACVAAGVDIVCGKTAVAEDVEGAHAVFATGASWSRAGYSPYRPDRDTIPGWDQTFVIDIGTAVRRAVEDPNALGRRVLIIEECGDYLPLGLAEALAESGVEVEIVTPRPIAGADAQRTLDLPHIMPRLKKLGVQITTQHFIDAIADHTVGIYDVWGGEPVERINIDTVVVAISRVPNDTLFLSAQNGCRSHHRIGDVVAPRRLEAVIYEAERLAREL